FSDPGPVFHTIVSIKNDGHYFCRAGGNRPDGLNEPVTYSDTLWHEDSGRNRWFSVMAGPSVRVNEGFSAYAMAGVAYSRVSTFSGDYLRVPDNKGKTHDVLT
ncbi:Ail/Lom family outer membrane beta-barrel protein, partial [Escherichia coli]|uniref:Ail/Lom family outer membrane beta-barrel protein n=1 Tax=Escherichia coli TaxID=562 RepID=UPI003C6D54AF